MELWFAHSAESASSHRTPGEVGHVWFGVQRMVTVYGIWDPLGVRNGIGSVTPRAMTSDR